MKVICINDKDRPNEVPLNRWIKLNEEYTITKIMIMKTQGNIGGVKLAEINNDDLFPWTYFRLDRFAVNEKELEKLIEQNQLETEFI